MVRTAEIPSAAFIFQKINYIHNNPVEAGIVEKPALFIQQCEGLFLYKEMWVVGFGVFINNNIFSNKLQTHYNNRKDLILLKEGKTKENDGIYE